VYAVVPGSGLESGVKVAGAEVLVVRQLAALLEESSLGVGANVAQRVMRYRGVIEQAFTERSVVPLPCGTSFRSRASVERWLELHHSPLQEALEFVAERAMMRVRAGVAGTPASEAAAASVDGRLWTALRGLKGDAIAAIPVVANADARAARDAICAYLIDRDAIAAFEQRVANLTSTEPHLHFELSGPFPAYDFVQMDFGG
jgi:hypothetical protein